jgi:hypothetical protein
MTHVPTVPELAHLGLARAVTTRGQALAYVVSDEGHKMMDDAMRANALEAIAAGEADWSPPPTTAVPLSTLIDRETPE